MTDATEDTMTLQDESDLRKLAAQYARTIDDKDLAALRPLFADDARLAMTQDPTGPAPGFQETFGGDVICTNISHVFTKYDQTFHFIGQHLIDSVDSAQGRATGLVYCVAHHFYRVDAARWDRVLHLRYFDRYSRIDGSWRFADRNLVVTNEHRGPYSDLV